MIKDCLDEEQNVRKPTERGEEGCLTNRSMKQNEMIEMTL